MIIYERQETILNYLKENTKLEITPVGMGVLPIGPNQRALPVDDGAAIIRHALDRGINFIDTARGYTNSEVLFGSALKGRREKFYIFNLSFFYD